MACYCASHRRHPHKRWYTWPGGVRHGRRARDGGGVGHQATARSIAAYGALALAAFAGREAEASELIENCWKNAERRGEGGRADLHRLDDVAGAAQASAAMSRRWPQPTGKQGTRPRIRRTGRKRSSSRRRRGSGASRARGRSFRRLSATPAPAGHDRALGVEARSRAPLSDGDNAEARPRGDRPHPPPVRARHRVGRAAAARAHRRPASSPAPHTRCSPSTTRWPVRRTSRTRAAGNRRTGTQAHLRAHRPATARQHHTARGWPTACSTPRSLPSSSSARALSNTTCTKSSPQLVISPSRNQLHSALATTEATSSRRTRPAMLASTMSAPAGTSAPSPSGDPDFWVVVAGNITPGAVPQQADC